MEENLLEAGVLNPPKHADREPTFLRRTTTWLLRTAFVSRLIDFVGRHPVVVRAGDVVSRCPRCPFVVRRAVQLAGSASRRTWILFLACGLFFYVAGVVNVYLWLFDTYDAYLYHNIGQFVDTVAMEDPKVVTFMRQRYLVPPPGPHPRPSYPACDDDSYRASPVYGFLKDKTGGFYVEYGRQAGETELTCCVLEQRQNWTGLIIEEQPEEYELLLMKRRRAHLSQACLSTKPYPVTKWVPVVSGRRTIAQWWYALPPAATGLHTAVQVQCFPLFSFLLAVGRQTVDFLSLDAGGQELLVLQNIPWDRVHIRVMSVKQYFYLEQSSSGVLKDRQVPADKKLLVKYLKERGYKSYGDDGWFSAIRTTETVFVRAETDASSDTY